MARIRTLKPEHFLDARVGKLTDRQYRVWAALLLHSDDYGYQRLNFEELRVLVYSYHPAVKVSHVTKTVHEITGTGLIRLYEVDGQTYVWFPNWEKHQRVSHPQPTLCPLYRSELEVAAAGPREKGKPAAPDDGLFDRFWSEYPKKKARGDAYKAWQRLQPSAEQVDQMLVAIRAQRESWDWRKDNGQFIPYPATWLNQERWHDEVKPARPANGNGVGGRWAWCAECADYHQAGNCHKAAP